MYSETNLKDKIKKKKIKTEDFEKEKKDSFFYKRTQRLFKGIEQEFERFLRFQWIFSTILVLLGLIFVLWPVISNQVVGIILGILFVFYGFLQIYFFLRRSIVPIFHFYIIYGLLAIILGILTILNPFVILGIIVKTLGIWIIFEGIIKIEYAIRFHKIAEDSWFFQLMSGLLTICMGFLLFFNPFAQLSLTVLVGSFGILYGILNFTDTVMLKKRARNILSHFE